MSATVRRERGIFPPRPATAARSRRPVRALALDREPPHRTAHPLLAACQSTVITSSARTAAFRSTLACGGLLRPGRASTPATCPRTSCVDCGARPGSAPPLPSRPTPCARQDQDGGAVGAGRGRDRAGGGVEQSRNPKVEKAAEVEIVETLPLTLPLRSRQIQIEMERVETNRNVTFLLCSTLFDF